MQAGQRGMEPIEAAEVVQAAVLARLGWDDRAAPAGEGGVAVGHYGGEPVHGAAQDDDHEAVLCRRGGQCERGAAQGDGGAEAEEGRAAGESPHPARSATYLFRKERRGHFASPASGRGRLAKRAG